MQKLLLLSFLLLTLNARCMTPATDSEENTFRKARRVTLALPVDVNFPQGQRTQFFVTLPEKFLPLSYSINHCMDFIPREESPRTWTKLVTTHILLRQAMQSTQMTDYLKAIHLKEKDASIIEEKVALHEGILSSHLIMAYERNGRNEMLLAFYCSGRSDCSGFQYTQALDQENTPEKALKKLWQFKADNTRFFKY